MYRPWSQGGRSSSIPTSSAYPIYPDYTLRQKTRQRRRSTDEGGAIASKGGICHGDHDMPPPYTVFDGYVHVKALSLAKLSILVLWLSRESQLQMMDMVCRNGTSGELLPCSRSPCAWLHMLFGGLPYGLQIDALCNALLLLTMTSALLCVGALWLRQRQASERGRPPSTLLKVALLVPYSVLELTFMLALMFHTYLNVTKRGGVEMIWSIFRGIVVCSVGGCSCLLHAVTCSYIFCRRVGDGDEDDEAREAAGMNDTSYGAEWMMSNMGRRDDHEAGFARQIKSGVLGVPLLGAGGRFSPLPPNHMTQLPPGGNSIYHSATASPGYYNEQMQPKSTSSEESGVSSVGYGRLRQALRQQAKASRAAAMSNNHHQPLHALHLQQQQHHHRHPHSATHSPLMQMTSSSSSKRTGGGGGAGSRSGTNLTDLAPSASAASSLAASSVAGIAPPPIMMSPGGVKHSSSAASLSSPYIIDENTADYSQVRSLRQAELLRQNARSRRNSPASRHSQDISRKLTSSDGRPLIERPAESAYLEVI